MALSDSIKYIVNVIEDIRNTMREMEARVKSYGCSLDTLETELQRQLSVQERTAREIQKLKNELEPLKATMLANERALSVMKKNIPAAFSENSAAESLNSQLGTTSPSKLEAPIDKPIEHNVRKQETEVSVMHGSGFSHVTFDYLKKLGEK